MGKIRDECPCRTVISHICVILCRLRGILPVLKYSYELRPTATDFDVTLSFDLPR
jgi:hypothetical protein